MLPYLLEKLKNTPDGDGNLLDNSLIIYGSPMGDSNIHNHKRVPLLLAGHAGGKLTGGMHIKAPDGTPMANAMLTDAAHARPHDLQTLRRQHGRARPEQTLSVDVDDETSRRRARSDHATNADERPGRSACARWWPLAALIHAAAPAGAAAFVDAAMNGNRDAVRAAAEGRRRRQHDAGRRHDARCTGRRRTGDVELAKMLVYASANLKATTRIGGYTPLLIASKNGDAPMIETLAQAGADVNATTTNGTTPLMLASAAGNAGRRPRAHRPRRQRQRARKRSRARPR